MVRQYTALFLSLVSLAAAPTSFAFSPLHQTSSTPLSNTILSSTFCAEADLHQLTHIPPSDSTLSSARGWMEHIEQQEGPKFGVGSYTVLRCDAILHPKNDVSTQEYCEWKIWGEQFHMDRLSSSFRTLTENLFGPASLESGFGSFQGGGITSMSGMGSSVHTQSMSADSIKESRFVMNTLLEQASRSIISDNAGNFQEERSLTHTLMLTILWTPSATSDGSSQAVKPKVRGHAAFTNTTPPSILPTPITASLAIPKQPTLEALSVLPRRHGMNLNQQRQVGSSASAKLSSWCRIRRPLEDPNRYKPPGVGEVILVRQPNTDERGTNIMTYSNDKFIETLELLEGLISNLFVVYRDGTVRTAPVGLVLPGYARHLIIQELNERGLKVDSSKPPTMQDMRDGLWSEVFVTSAIRLVVPVERIIMPAVGANVDPVVLWEASNNEYEMTKTIQAAIYERGSSQATVKNVVIYD